MRIIRKPYFIIAIVIVIVAMLLIGCLLGMFLPRKLVKIIPLEEIVKVEFWEADKIINVFENEEILIVEKMFKEKKYSPRYFEIKTQPVNTYYFYYANGDKIEYSKLYVRKFDSQGELIFNKKIYEKN